MTRTLAVILCASPAVAPSLPLSGLFERRGDMRLNPKTLKFVHALMRSGLGYDDIAARIKINPAYVRQEAARLKSLGKLDDMYRGWRA